MKKLTKSMVCLAALLVVAASTMGCAEKATGGGWFYDEESKNKCTIGFNALSGAVENENVYTGQFQFKDHGTGVKFHIEEITFVDPDAGDAYSFEGYDKGGKFVKVCCRDSGTPGELDRGDYIKITRESDTWSGLLEGGNIVVVAHRED